MTRMDAEVRDLRRRLGRLQEHHDRVVYFLQARFKEGALRIDGPIKIGMTNELEKRMRALRTMSPVRLHLLAAVPGGFELEREMHRKFAHHRLHGEWFRPDAMILHEMAVLRSQEARLIYERRVLYSGRMRRLRNEFSPEVNALVDAVPAEIQQGERS